MIMDQEDLYSYYNNTALGEECNSETHCEDCDKLGICETCDTVEGRVAGTILTNSGDMITGAFDYANTCDACYDLTQFQLLNLDPLTQLAYCDGCMPHIDPEIFKRIMAFQEAGEPEEMMCSLPLRMFADE